MVGDIVEGTVEAPGSDKPETSVNVVVKRRTLSSYLASFNVRDDDEKDNVPKLSF
jgi:hypothetical protein